MKFGASLFVKNKRIFVFLVCILWVLPSLPLQGQETRAPAATSPEQEKNQKFKIRVEVDEVRIDVVVLDWRGRQITDLTAKDFVILQDYKRQEITSCRYVKESPVRLRAAH